MAEQDPHHDIAADLALYAAGAIDSAETAALEAHFANCAACREEAARLLEAAMLLAPVAPADLDACWRRIEARVRAA
jgi:anti-sigma factor ChrR (cupin superfamily)